MRRAPGHRPCVNDWKRPWTVTLKAGCTERVRTSCGAGRSDMAETRQGKHAALGPQDSIQRQGELATVASGQFIVRAEQVEQVHH